MGSFSITVFHCFWTNIMMGSKMDAGEAICCFCQGQGKFFHKLWLVYSICSKNINFPTKTHTDTKSLVQSYGGNLRPKGIISLMALSPHTGDSNIYLLQATSSFLPVASVAPAAGSRCQSLKYFWSHRPHTGVSCKPGGPLVREGRKENPKPGSWYKLPC